LISAKNQVLSRIFKDHWGPCEPHPQQLTGRVAENNGSLIFVKTGRRFTVQTQDNKI